MKTTTEMRPDAPRIFQIVMTRGLSDGEEVSEAFFRPLARAPCWRNSGQVMPNWNHRTMSSRNIGSVVSPSRKPPMSVVQR